MLAGVSLVRFVGDTVFAQVDCTDGGSEIMKSQALFDSNGIIIGWKQWQPVLHHKKSISAFSLIKPSGSCFAISGDKESSQSIYYYGWQTDIKAPTNSLFKTVHTIFEDHGGISSLTDNNATHPALAQESVLIATGAHKVALIKTGSLIDDQLQVNDAESYSLQEYTDGTVNTPQESSILVCSGGALERIGHITSACFAADNNNQPHESWLAVGGSKGLAVLCAPDKSGWQTSRSLFARQEQPLTFTSVGNYSKIKKVSADNGYLYVLTDQLIDRIDLKTLRNNAPTITTIARKTKDGLGVLFDMIISEKLALAATSTGLYRLGNGKDVTTITDSNDAQWQKINLPESVLPIIKLMAYSSTGLEQDVARTIGGNIHVLGSYRGKNKSHLHRLAIRSTEGQQEINNETVTLMREEIGLGEKITLASFHTYKELFVTDGAFYFSFPGVDIEIPGLMCGLRQHEQNRFGLTPSDKISCIVQESASGKWLIGGTFGLLIHE